ncbi:MAG: heparinase [Paenibacillaceae bacterium]|nr:heparinase [Paenibacillaceae bacterium]
MANSYMLQEKQLRDTADWYRERFPGEARQSVEIADQAAGGSFKVAPSMLGDRYVQLGRPVDWNRNPCGDPEFTWVLNRHYHMRDLGKAYLLTGNESYVQAFQEHLRGWRSQNPVPQEVPYGEAVFFQRKGPWRLLEAGPLPKDTGRLHPFPAAGYHIYRSPRHYLFFDAGPLGGSHGHADPLHFEWFRSGKQLLVDPGRYTYEEGEWRRYFKGARAHTQHGGSGRPGPDAVHLLAAMG